MEVITNLASDGVTDDTTRINEFLTNMTGGEAALPPRAVCRFTSQIVVPDRKTLEGGGRTAHDTTDLRAASVLVKDGDFDGVKLGLGSTLRGLQVDGAPGNGGDGIYLLGQRAAIEHVAVTNQGQDSLRIGAKTGSVNTNLWKLTDFTSVDSGRHGIHVHDVKSATAPDANAGLALGLDIRTAGGDGINVGYSIDNQWHGVHVASVTGWGIRGTTGCEGNFFWAPYTELCTLGDGTFESGADDNVVWGVRSNTINDSWVDDGLRNVIMGRANETAAYAVGRLGFRRLDVLDNLYFGWSGADRFYQVTGGGEIRTDSRLRVGSGFYAARFIANLVTDGTSYLEMIEQTADPAAPAANNARIFTRDNGAGKTQVCVLFPTGAVQVLATEP